MSKFDMINSELQEVTNWFKANKLSVNASKTNYMLLGTNHKLSRLDESASIILDNTTLKRVNNTKFLRVTIDENQIILKLFQKIYPGGGNYQQTKTFCTWRRVIFFVLYFDITLHKLWYNSMGMLKQIKSG